MSDVSCLYQKLQKIANEAEMLVLLRRKKRTISRDVVTNWHSLSITPRAQAFCTLLTVHLSNVLIFLQQSTMQCCFRALKQPLRFIPESSPLQWQGRDSYACRLAGSTLYSQPARIWGCCDNQSVFQVGGISLLVHLTPVRESMCSMFEKGQRVHCHCGHSGDFLICSLSNISSHLNLSRH